MSYDDPRGLKSIPKYIKQPNDFSCGPTTIINIGKWAGANLSLKKDFKRIESASGCSKDGTLIHNLDKIMRTELSSFCHIRRIKIPLIFKAEDHLKKGGALVLSFSFKDRSEPNGLGAHVCLFTDVYKGRWVGHNLDSYENTTLASRKLISKFFYDDVPFGPALWLLKKK